MNKQAQIMELFNQGFKLIELYGIDNNGSCTCYNKSNCNCAGKHPVRNNWQNNYIKSKNELELIFKNHPYANFGIITGDGLVVIDVDAKNDGLKSLEEIKNLITPTLTIKTGGGGYHFYYHTTEKVNNRTGILKGIDIRGDGGYVVAPGSKHKSGKNYIIIKGEENEN